MRAPFVLTLLLSTLILAVAHTAAQDRPVLHIRIVLVDADLKATPVPRHALLISDNPATSTPRRVLTDVDGRVDVRLRPGNYTVESDVPVAFRGKAYQWVQTLDIAAGRDSTLELTSDNAEVGSVTDAATTAATPENDPSFLMPEWQASVVSIWTPTAHASGFVVDANGLIATSGRAVGSATSVEVQLTPSVKVTGSVLASDPKRDVAVVRIDPTAAATLRPLSLGCAQASKTHVTAGQAVFTIGGRPLQPNEMASGTVSRVEAHVIASDLPVRVGSEGGPVFTADGIVVGISSIADDADTRGARDADIIPVDDACAIVAAAEKKTKEAPAPSGVHLPVEPTRRFPESRVKSEAERRTVGLTGYQLSSSDFDITFMTPPLVDAARSQADQAVRRNPTGAGRTRDTTDDMLRRLIDFGNWSDYVATAPPVLLVRVTPRLVEGFWTKMARGAAMTQGMALPAMPHLASGFSRMRVLCGDREVAPIHPFRIDTPISDRETVSEGLYVFDPDALSTSCADVKVVLYSQKQPEKADTRAVDARMVQRIWDDFAPYRSLP